MPAHISKLLERLEAAKRLFGHKGIAGLEKTLKLMAHRRISDPEQLIRFHESLLFFRAYPPTAGVLRQVERSLSTFRERVEALRKSGVDLSQLAHPEVSGIAGTSVTDTFGYYLVCWLQRHYPSQIALDWEWFEEENRLAATWPRLLPLLEEDAYVEANVPYQRWLQAAMGQSRDLAWLLSRFEFLPLTDEEKAELFDSQKLYVRWTPEDRATRTGMKRATRSVFYHRPPLISRRQVSLTDEMRMAQFSLHRLSKRRGESILNLARETSTVRYRELYGFTHGDPERVVRASVGRGVDLFVIGLLRERRLPLRAYHAALIFKNGVPVAYFEGLSLFERMESGFNLYYSFREGETAWIYAKTLALFHRLLGVDTFTIDPYQIGYENEEGIESGAFWFYRKVGFSPARQELLEIVKKEEERLAARSGYRTPARVLRKLADGPLIFAPTNEKRRDWGRFQVRTIGLAIQRRMAAEFKGDANLFRTAASTLVSRVTGLKPKSLTKAELNALDKLAPALQLIPNLELWSAREKRALAQVIRAKAAGDEMVYLRLLQLHERLREGILKLGS